MAFYCEALIGVALFIHTSAINFEMLNILISLLLIQINKLEKFANTLLTPINIY